MNLCIYILAIKYLDAISFKSNESNRDANNIKGEVVVKRLFLNLLGQLAKNNADRYVRIYSLVADLGF